MAVMIVATIVKLLVYFGILMLFVAYGTLAERKVAGHIQDRLGPFHCGPHGVLQPFADGIKLFFKEDMIAAEADKFVYFLAPALAVVPPLLVLAIIPVGDKIELFGKTIPLSIADINIAVLYFLGVTSLSVYAIMLGGWAGNSKYPLLGGLRSAAQFISYELVLGLSIIGVVMLVGSFNLLDIVRYQKDMWLVVKQPVAFIAYMIAAIAELNRAPFDLPEAESELVGGYHTEYSSMKFALFFLGEYANMVASSAIASALFLGGWYAPWHVLSFIPGPIWFLLKTFALFFFMLWIRWTYPRLRYDQLMGMCWKYLIPITLFNILGTGLVVIMKAGGM